MIVRGSGVTYDGWRKSNSGENQELKVFEVDGRKRVALCKLLD
jgi:hypothetical protein